MAWLTLEGQRHGLFDASYGTSLRLVAILALGVIAILRSARWADRLETKREAVEIERDRFFELSLDMLSVVGADGRFQRVNGAWNAILGYCPDERVGRSFLDLVHPADLDRTIAESARHYADGENSTHGRTGLSRLIIGSVARDVLHHATCSVLIRREGSAQAEPVPLAAAV